MLFNERSTVFRCWLRGHVVRPVVCFRRAGNINVWVPVVGCIYLVALAEALDDVQVRAGRFHEAVLQQPALGLRVGVALPQHVFQGGLEETNPRQHWQLKRVAQKHISEHVTQACERNSWYKAVTQELCVFCPYGLLQSFCNLKVSAALTDMQLSRGQWESPPHVLQGGHRDNTTVEIYSRISTVRVWSECAIAEFMQRLRWHQSCPSLVNTTWLPQFSCILRRAVPAGARCRLGPPASNTMQTSHSGLVNSLIWYPTLLVTLPYVTPVVNFG